MKTNPINNLFCMGVILFFSYSCVPSKIITTIFEYKVVNLLDKKLYVECITDVGEENGICYPHDSIIYKFTKTEKKDSHIVLGPIDPDINLPIMEPEIIYNLSDTTVLKQINELNEQERELYFNHLKGTQWDTYKIEIFYIDEEILPLFIKDTTMLEKFKDYYSTQP